MSRPRLAPITPCSSPRIMSVSILLPAKRWPSREKCRNPLGCEPDHRAHTHRYEGPEMVSMGSTSAPHEGQWNVSSGRRRIYLLQGKQHRSTQFAPTRAAAGTFATEGL